MRHNPFSIPNLGKISQFHSIRLKASVLCLQLTSHSSVLPNSHTHTLKLSRNNVFRALQIIIYSQSPNLESTYLFFRGKILYVTSVEFKCHSTSDFLNQNRLVFLFHGTFINFLKPILKLNSLHTMFVFLVYCNILKETIIFYPLFFSMAPGTRYIFYQIKSN